MSAVRFRPKPPFGGLAQLGEHLPYKQRVGGSSPSSSTIKVLLAQLVEHLTFNQRVRGSSPLQDTILNAGVAELADALDLGSSTFGVQVQLLSPAPFTLINLGKIFKSFIFFYF